MKPEQSFPNFLEFARCASEGVADMNQEVTGLNGIFGDEGEVYFPKAIPLSESDRSDLYWLALTLHYVFTLFCQGDAKFYGRVLKELETVKTEDQIRELLVIEEEYAAMELVGYDDQWVRLELIKKALSEEIRKKIS